MIILINNQNILIGNQHCRNSTRMNWENKAKANDALFYRFAE